MTQYIHELPNWPKFGWDQRGLAAQLAAVRHRQGRLIGRMQALGFPQQEEAVLATLTEDVLKSSEIEGEILDKVQVRSSIARRLGMDAGALPPADRNVEGVVEMTLDATQKFKQKLTSERLFGWHAALFPTGRSGMRKIVVGAWRDGSAGPMQVVSGPAGRERVHYEAPAAGRLDAEMQRSLNGSTRTRRSIPSSRLRSRISGLSPFTRSRTATDVSRVLSRTCRLRVRRKARNASTVCRHKSASSESPITTCLKARKRAISTSRDGLNGFWDAWIAHSTEPKPSLPPFCKRPNSGRSTPAPGSTTGNAIFSIACWTDLKAS